MTILNFAEGSILFFILLPFPTSATNSIEFATNLVEMPHLYLLYLQQKFLINRSKTETLKRENG